jgi:hypothetical protein
MNKIFYITTLLIGMSLMSCESFFDVKPHDSTEVSDILANENDAQTLLNGMYRSFKSSASYGRYLTVLTDIMTDASLATSGFTNQMGYMYAWNIQPGVSEVGAVWTNHYSAIYNANFLITHLGTINGDENNLNRIKGEALIGRALLHYNLVRLYAKSYNPATASSDLGVPYISTNEIASPKRHSVDQVYAFILADLQEALGLLSDAPSADNVVFTSHFARGLLARLALEMKNYEEAIVHATSVIENSGCTLAQGDAFRAMWLMDMSQEIIWKVGYTSSDKGAAPGYNFANRNHSEKLPQPDYIPANWVLELYDAENDIRFESYFVYTPTEFGWDGYLINKYPTNPLFPFTMQGLNMPKPMRLAEMYLIRAEAHAWLDEDADARADLDVLLNTRLANHTTVAQSGDQLKAFIQEERIRELIYEGFYFHDLKRNGLGFERVPQDNTSAANDLKIEADDYRWLWPIPTVEIVGNDNIKQNDGY